MTFNPFLVPIPVYDVILARLAFRGSGAERSINQFAADIKAYASKQQVMESAEQLVAEGMVTADPKLKLTEVGRSHAKARFGEIRGGQRHLENVVLPALALGLDPKSDAAARLSRGENLRAVALARALQLRAPMETVTLSQVIGIILARSAAGFSIGSEFGNAAGGQPQTAAFTDLDSLRKALVKRAVSLSFTSQRDEGDDKELGTFAFRVKGVAAKLETPPFSHKVSISQVYDAYGRLHSDVGSLDAFKARLFKAHVEDHLTLLPLDDPAAMSSDLRKRSEIPADLSPLHFVETPKE